METPIFDEMYPSGLVYTAEMAGRVAALKAEHESLKAACMTTAEEELIEAAIRWRLLKSPSTELALFNAADAALADAMLAARKP